MKELFVTKRNGEVVPFDASKINKVIGWAVEGVSDVSASDVAMKAELHLSNKVKTSDIHEAMVMSAAELIDENNPNYQVVAGRLINYGLRKDIYASFNPPSLLEHIKKVVKLDYYSPEALEKFTEEEINYLDSKINHDNDFKIVFAGMEQFKSKYLIRNRETGKFYETPQMAFMLISMFMFIDDVPEKRMELIVDFYNCLSNFDISLPTPIYAKLRTSEKTFSSCTLIDCDDSIDGIIATTASTTKYVTKNAGIGLNLGRIRAEGSPIRNGSVTHTGVSNFVRLFQAAVNSVNQGSIRKGSATGYYPIWHREFEELIVLKNGKGTEYNRARDMDYGVQINGFFYDKLINNEDITLFSPHDVPDMYEAFFNDQEKFAELYVKYEKTIPKKHKKVIKAIDVFSMLITERKETGRIYVMNVDNCNIHGAFDEKTLPLLMSNLCCEILLPTVAQKTYDDDIGLIALCTLASVNQGNVTRTSDYEKTCMLLVRGLDNLLTYQDYPLKASKRHTELFRPLGIGLGNYAYWLAKTDNNYSTPNLEIVDEYMEAFTYYCIKASADLAIERGACLQNDGTKYSKGILPLDTYNKNVDNLVKPNLRMDWESLRTQLKQYGIRNATLNAQMPNESNSLVINATNGIEPIRSLVVTKRSSNGIIKQVAPQLKKLKNKYELLWEQPSPRGYLKHCAVIQKWFDQAISVNTSYNPKFYPNNQLDMKTLLQDLILHWKYGGKTLYYFNTFIDNGDVKEEQEDEENCEACVI